MNYNRYGKTKNVTDAKNLRQWLAKFPELDGQDYVITEKIDGSNFQLIFGKGVDLRFGSRNNELDITSDFFDFQNAVLVQYADNIDMLQDYVDTCHDIDEIQLFGELFGGGIQRRINYGPEKQYLPFHMRIDGRPVSYHDADIILRNAGINPDEWWVPLLGAPTQGEGLEAALDFGVEGVETHASKGDNLTGNMLIEGVVIEPASNVFSIYHEQDETTSRFMLKKKSEGFYDAANVRHKKMPQHHISLAGAHLMRIWIGMFNDNRMQDLCSKMGRPTEMGQMGEYIKALIADVREDFINLHKSEFIGLTQGDRGVIMKSGGKLAAKVVRCEIEK